MDFDLTEDQKAFRDTARDFVRKELTEGALERAHSSDYPWDVAKKLADLGLLGITAAEANGGGTLMDAVIAIEQVAVVCPRSADVSVSISSDRARLYAGETVIK
jgi:alkylation response protein AidB-like acyl-CoA dehydrogenase